MKNLKSLHNIYSIDTDTLLEKCFATFLQRICNLKESLKMKSDTTEC